MVDSSSTEAGVSFDVDNVPRTFIVSFAQPATATSRRRVIAMALQSVDHGHALEWQVERRPSNVTDFDVIEVENALEQTNPCAHPVCRI